MQWFSHIFTGLTRVILRAKNTENISERQFSGSPIHEKNLILIVLMKKKNEAKPIAKQFIMTLTT